MSDAEQIAFLRHHAMRLVAIAKLHQKTDPSEELLALVRQLETRIAELETKPVSPRG